MFLYPGVFHRYRKWCCGLLSFSLDKLSATALATSLPFHEDLGRSDHWRAVNDNHFKNHHNIDIHVFYLP